MVAYENHSIVSARFCGGSLGSSKNFCLYQCVIGTWSDGAQFANAHNSRSSTYWRKHPGRTKTACAINLGVAKVLFCYANLQDNNSIGCKSMKNLSYEDIAPPCLPVGKFFW